MTTTPSEQGPQERDLQEPAEGSRETVEASLAEHETPPTDETGPSEEVPDA